MDDFAVNYVKEVKFGPPPPPKRMIFDWPVGEVKVIKPPDPEKLKAYHDLQTRVKRRRVKAGLSEENNTIWGKV